MLITAGYLNSQQQGEYKSVSLQQAPGKRSVRHVCDLLQSFLCSLSSENENNYYKIVKCVLQYDLPIFGTRKNNCL